MLCEQTVVIDVEVRELHLARGSCALCVIVEGQRLRPRRAVLRGHVLGLEAVDAVDHAGQQHGRPAAEVVALQLQILDAVEQQRQAVGSRHGREERVDAGLHGLVAQHARAELLHGEHG